MKKNRFYGLGVPICVPRKTILMMKLTVLFALILNFSVGATTYAQLNNVSLKMEDASLEAVILELRNQTGVRFFYSVDKIKRIHGVSVDAKDEGLKNVLDDLLKNTSLTYTLVDDVVVIKDKSAGSMDLPQTKLVEIKGKVKDSKGETLPGVSILIKGTAFGGVTDANGDFKLNVPKVAHMVLRFSFVGMKPKEVSVVEGKVLNVVLEEDGIEIEEVVVTGYFNRNKDSYTGAATTFSGEKLREMSTSNILTTLSMIDPSFKLMENIEMGSDPNNIPEFTIRGESSLQGEYENSPNMPTFILDGFEVSSTKIFDLDPNQVASVTILKDAAATAIYGSRAANGVVVVETKAPEMGELKVSYRLTTDVEVADLGVYNLLNAEEKLEYERLAGLYTHVNGNVAASERLKARYNSRLALVKQGGSTDWLAKPVKDMGFSHKHSLTIEGGDKRLRYSLNASYGDDKGVMKESGRRNISVGVKLQYNYKNLRFINDITYLNVKAEDSPYGSFSTYANMNPYFSAVDENGNIKRIAFIFEDDLENPVYNPMYDATLATNKGSIYDDFRNNFSVEWDVFQGLKLKGKLSLDKKTTETYDFKPANHSSFATAPVKGSYTKGMSKNFSYDGYFSASYVKNIGLHLVNANFVWNVQEDQMDSFKATAYNFPNDNMDHFGMGIEYKEGTKPDGDYSIKRLMGFVGNFNYGYDNRYLIDFSVRSDGSSMFGANTRWGTFGSVGLAWNLHNEAWLKGSPVVNMLKVRGSIGTTGAQNFNSFQSITTFSYEDKDAYSNFIGASLIAYGNTDLQWQKTEKQNIGIDFSLVNNRLNGYLNFYRNTSQNLLVDISVAPSLGFPSYRGNVGEVENRGVEFNLRGRVYEQKAQRIQWDLFVNVVKNQNRLKKLNNALIAFNKKQDADKNEAAEKADDNIKEESDLDKKALAQKTMVRYQVGESTNTIWANESLGIDPATGEEIFLDQNGNKTNVWSTDNYKPLGCKDPMMEGNFGTMFMYGGFQLNAYFRYSYGGDIYNSTLVSKVENVDPKRNADKRVLYDRWKKAGDVAKYKSISNKKTTQETSRFIEQENYISMSSLNLSYQFSTGQLKKIGIERLKFSLIGNEIFRLSTVKMERGTSYPFARTYSFTAQVTF